MRYKLQVASYKFTERSRGVLLIRLHILNAVRSTLYAIVNINDYSLTTKTGENRAGNKDRKFTKNLPKKTSSR
jgi:hypothetical protein